MRQPFLRRPFSIADRWTDDDGSQHLVVISRAIGVGTGWLDRLRPGQVLNLSGPFGRPFCVPQRGTSLVLVGGGVGIPPLLYLARRLQELGHEDVTVIFGATTRNLFPVPLTEEPRADGTPMCCVRLPGNAPYAAAVTTDDGSFGLRGVVTDALAVWERSRQSQRSSTTVFACGPEGMLRAVAGRTREHGFACQLCIERTMGCGFGTCLSCVTRVRDPSRDPGWRWALTCSDGPVFERDALFDY